ncbi:MAG TPA: hypothetical protein VGZ27_12500 [Vicinamibacterales bacterium]|jgi:hypothetical protein|nr:hypothetical protein [Vicinamibacterales bacterium]
MLALGLTGCARLLDTTRLSYLAIDESPPQSYLPVLQALVRTVLPFDHPRFPPVSPEAIDQRLLKLFPFRPDDEETLTLRRALMIFNDVHLFPAALPALLAQELNALGVDDRHSPAWSEAVGTMRAADERIYAQFSGGARPRPPEHFVDLTPEGRVEYYRLWSQSLFSVKRHFYRSTKTLILVSAWSMDEMWSSIGYAGPLVTGHDKA